MKKSKAFTLSEMLVVICIIAVIAALMISTLGDKVDRNKGLFKKAYSVTERTVVELVNDETYYPYDYDNFGFKEKTDVKIIGPDYYTSTTNYSSPVTTRNPDGCDELVKFCNLFSNNLNLNTKPKFEGTTTNCTFETTDGVAWKIEKSTAPVIGFMITIDTNGTEKEPNKPSSVSKVSKDQEGETKNRDVFYMYVRNDGKMQLPDDDEIAKNYLKSSDMNKEDKKDNETTGTGTTGTGTTGTGTTGTEETGAE